ncbi:MAG: type II toxin-antitoxin system VapC family toxin [Verrucomicrobia bacterium]|nr:type II toxin-antitoxin system VapC family toxin [Verrucomicrobiota bacterium]MCH8510013.1 type II toxin-antitoxin system VapC family toxin [Kiritimatiellia bacterium]
MTRLLDTDTCIDILRGVSAAVDTVSRYSPDDLAISSVTRYELLYGVARCPDKRREKETAKVHAFLRILHEIPFDSEAADLAALLRAELTSKGTPIGPMDLLIAATAKANRLILVTGKLRDFERIEALQLESWL